MSSTTTTVRPGRARRAGFVLLALALFGFVPALICLALVLEGGAGPVLAAGVVGVAAALLVVASVVGTFRHWEVTPDTVTLVRALRRPRVWQRDGLLAEAEVTPRYFRGVLVGRSRVLHLTGPGQDRGGRHDSVDVGLLGADGLTALVAALRPPRARRRSGRRVDERFTVDHDVITRYRRWRTKWRALGVLAGAAAFLAAGGLLDAGRDTLGSMLLATAVVIPAYVVFSLVQQVVRRPSGPVPLSVRVTTDSIDVELRGAAAPDRHPWADLARVEVSADLQEEAVLRLERRSGEVVGLSLTGRVGGDFRADVCPDLDELSDALDDAGAQHDVPVVELHR